MKSFKKVESTFVTQKLQPENLFLFLFPFHNDYTVDAYLQ